MDTSRIAALLAPFLVRRTDIGVRDEYVAHSGKPGAAEPAVLSAHQLQDISTYIDILQRWNARVNLTAIHDPEEIVTRHFGESLFAARHLFPTTAYVGTAAPGGPAEQGSAVDEAKVRQGGSTTLPIHMPQATATLQSSVAPQSTVEDHRGRAALQRRVNDDEKPGALAPAPITVADIGSGPGFPGIPIKLWAPDISLTLIESNHKKATFLREVARALTLTDVNIQNARAESLAGRSFDVVILRAVERFETILPIAGRLLAPQGRLALLVGSAQADQALSATSNLSWLSPLPIPGSHSRVLLIANNG